MLSRLRGPGIGKEAMQRVEALCRDWGADRLWLTANEGNRLAIRVYQRLGFVTTGPVVQEIGGGFGMDDFRMEKGIR